MAQQRIRLGILGCGIIAGEAHVPALQRLNDRFEVTALCNRSRPKAEGIARTLGLGEEAIWSDWRELLARAPVEAVLVCLPIELNCPVSEAAAAAGKHVLCEKPMGQSLEEVGRAVRFSERYGVSYMVAEDCHYEPVFVRAAELVRQGAVGELTAIAWNAMRFMELSNKYARTAWRIGHVYPGGYLLDGGVHNLHVLQMIAGRVRAVKAEISSHEPGLGQVDTALALLRHEGGALTSLNLGWRAREQGEPVLRIYGTEATLLVEGGGITRLLGEGRSERITVEQEDAFYLELADFHRAVTTGAAPDITPESTAHDVEVALALLEAAGRDTTVLL